MRLQLLRLILPAAALLAPLLPVPARASTAAPVEQLEQMALELVNRERAENNLPPLAWDERLTVAARQHSEEMRDLGYMGHESPVAEFRNLPRRLALAGVSECTSGENVGYFASNKDGMLREDFIRKLHENLMNSPRHRANILNPEFNTAGMGVATGSAPYEDDPAVSLPAAWITQNFTRRTLVIERANASISADGVLVQITGTTAEQQLFLNINDRRNEPLEKVRLAEGRFDITATIPFSLEKSRIELCTPRTERSYRVVNAFDVFTAALPENALKPAPDKNE
jgi:uncharacterized protein YkwD